MRKTQMQQMLHSSNKSKKEWTCYFYDHDKLLIEHKKNLKKTSIDKLDVHIFI